ncbi:hypothetical protein ACIGN6_06510 [Streptomyces sp. NPDC053792]|uniref:hypothetical protein n=1 Tax=Streptomyces sp. NPDC053792 TaxID=3365716 RepID=UPI0037D5B74D
MRGRARRWTALLTVAGALLALPACASSVDPIERLGRKAAERVSPPPAAAPHVRAVVDAKSCGEAGSRRTVAPAAGPAITPRSDELALRLTEC